LNIYQYVSHSADRYPEKTAIICSQQELSFSELMDKVDLVATNLVGQGVCPGDHIALFASNSIDFAVALLAAARIGLVVAPLPVGLKGIALANSLSSTKSQFVIAWYATASRIVEAGLLDRSCIITLGRSLEGCVSFDHLQSSLQGGSSAFDRLDNIPQPDADADFILTLTSGSTGQPKPIVFSQRTKITRAFNATVDYYGLSSDDVFLVSTPLYHSLAQRSLLAPLMIGATVAIMPKFSVSGWLEYVARCRVSFMFSVSSQLKALLPRLQSGDLSSIRCIVSSSATLTQEDKHLLIKALNCSLHECYGASELGVVTDFTVNDKDAPTASVGKPLPIVQVKICSESREELPFGSIGEIACRSETEFKGYFDQPEQTQLAMDSDGYFYTGDLGYMDASGYLYFCGRKKEVIKSGGISIYPADIEAVIARVDGIDQCAAIGVPDAQFGEVIWLAYTVKQSDDVALKALMQAAMNELLDYQLPRRYIKFDQFPKTELGKVLKPQIKQRLLGSSVV